MSSTIDPSLSPLKPVYAPPADPSAARNEGPRQQALIDTLGLIPHIEGGYFVELDRDPLRVPNPFLSEEKEKEKENENERATNPEDEQTTFYTSTGAVSADLSDKLTVSDRAEKEAASETSATRDQEESKGQQQHATRNASTSIHYLLTPASPLGAFHRNRGRTIHTLHRGRGRYVIIHADAVMGKSDTHHGVRDKARVETFVVGQDVARGERIQWVVEGAKYKSSFLLDGGEGDSEGLLISETVVPGFEYSDHDFMKLDRLEALVTKDQADEMKWMLRKDDKPSV